jgi:hypothetical protein
MVLPPEMFLATIDTELLEQIKTGQHHNQVMLDALEALNTGVLPMQSTLTDWKLDRNLVFYKDRHYILDNLELQQNIIRCYHNSLPMGHPGHLRTLELV